MKKKVGLIVNPIAGMGGKVGLKGTDGAEILKKAILIGATPESPRRAIRALERLAGLEDDLHFLTYPGEMGESELAPSGFDYTVIGSITPGDTTAEDTERAAREMQAAGVELLLFVGGDGTATKHLQRGRRPGACARDSGRGEDALGGVRDHPAKRGRACKALPSGKGGRNPGGRGHGHRRGRLPGPEGERQAVRVSPGPFRAEAGAVRQGGSGRHRRTRPCGPSRWM